MSHEEQAKYLLRGIDLAGTDYATLVKKIAEALQEAFDLGYCAAGGTIHKLQLVNPGLDAAKRFADRNEGDETFY